MTKKLIFTLLMSGVILSPLGVYAMDDEGGAPSSSISRAAPSSQVEKVPPPPINRRGLKVLPGEHLKLKGDNWTNEEGTIVLPAVTTGYHGYYHPTVVEDGKTTHLGYVSGTLFPMISPSEKVAEHQGEFIGKHYIFSVTKNGIDAFPYTEETGGAPSTSISRAAPSSQAGVEEKVPPPPINRRGLKVSPGEHLKLKGDNWTNEEGTIVLPAVTTGYHGYYNPTAIEDGKTTHLGFVSGTAFPMFSPSEEVAKHTGQFIGEHYIFNVTENGIDAFPYTKE